MFINDQISRALINPGYADALVSSIEDLYSVPISWLSVSVYRDAAMMFGGC